MDKDKYFGLSPRIARWKLDTPFENWLGEKADKSEFWKKLYNFYYRLLDTKYYNVGVGMVDKFIEMHKNDFQSVNSLRVVTFVLNEKVNIIGVTWRIGVGGAVMDNAGSGGIYASIDFENGFVQTDAINYKGDHFNVHPDTHVQIIGYKLPQWKEALALIEEMATTVKGTTLISWDIAYSTKGWLMVEANDNGDWSLIQSNKRIGKKNELFSYMDKFNKQNVL